MNDYAKGILTGASLILCFFMFVSAKSQENSFDTLYAKSIVVGEPGTAKMVINPNSIGATDSLSRVLFIIGGGADGGFFRAKSSNGKSTAYLGMSEDGAGGVISVFNPDGKEIINLGGEEGGAIKASNPNGENGVTLWAGKDGTGTLVVTNSDGLNTVNLVGRTGSLFTVNANGDLTVGLGTDKDGTGSLVVTNSDGTKTTAIHEGYLRTSNKDGVETGYFGTGKDNDGIAILYDRYGDAGWSASGKK
jgi:hypothetical protein